MIAQMESAVSFLIRILRIEIILKTQKSQNLLRIASQWILFEMDSCHLRFYQFMSLVFVLFEKEKGDAMQIEPENS